jgi:adenylate cyclase
MTAKHSWRCSPLPHGSDDGQSRGAAVTVLVGPRRDRSADRTERIATRILVVDDEPDLETLLTQKFRRQIAGGSVNFLFAHDGVEALSMLAANGDVDMVVTDINMPRMDGLTLLQKLQENEDKLSTIIVSAYGDMSNIRTAMNRGAFDFLTKPIDFSDLEATIAKTIRHVQYLREARRRQVAAERAYASLSRYFSPNLAERLAGDTEAVDLGGQRREIATLFTDIASFTALVETLEPSVLGPLLNDYLAGMTDIVFAHDGTVAKIVGDALHVLFGAPGEQPDHAARAVACALDLDEYAQSFRKRWQTKDIALGATRIGVHAGPAIVGNFGGGRFFDYTAYGDTINVAARLEAANKPLGTRICVSAALAGKVDEFRGRPVGDLLLRGRNEAMRAFEPLRAAQYNDPATKSYLEAFAKLEAGDPGAIAAFAAHVGKQPDDQLASFHLKRLLNGATGILIGME